MFLMDYFFLLGSVDGVIVMTFEFSEGKKKDVLFINDTFSWIVSGTVYMDIFL